LPFIFLVQFYTGSTQFTLDSELGNNIGYYVGHLLLFLSIFGIAKTAIYPLHAWLPAAMIAPYPVSALLHAVAVVKAGLFCIFKIIIYVFGFDYLYELTSSFNWPLMVAIFTMLYASYKAVTHDSIKNILAYSTISQLAMAMIAAFIFTEKSMEAAITHMIAHSFAKIVLFFTAGRFYSSISWSL
jgi:multicomponent Na+:H+ antiporter subunit D